MKRAATAYTVRVPPVGRRADRRKRPALCRGLGGRSGRACTCCTWKARCGPNTGRWYTAFWPKNPDLGFCTALVQTRTNVFLRRTNMPELATGGHSGRPGGLRQVRGLHPRRPRQHLPAAGQQEMLLNGSAPGAGLLMLGGYHSLGPGGYAGTPLGQALPVEAGRSGHRPVYPAAAARADRRRSGGTRFLPISASSFPRNRGPRRNGPGLPPLDGCTRVRHAPAPGLGPGRALGRGRLDARAGRGAAGAQTDRAVFAGDTTRNWRRSTASRPSCRWLTSGRKTPRQRRRHHQQGSLHRRGRTVRRTGRGAQQGQRRGGGDGHCRSDRAAGRAVARRARPSPDPAAITPGCSSPRPTDDIRPASMNGSATWS